MFWIPLLQLRQTAFKRKEMLPPFWNKVHGSEVSIFVLDFSPQTYMCYWIVFLEVSITPSSLWGGQGLLGKTYCSHLSPNGDLYEMDTLVKLTPRVGPWFSLFPLFDCLWDKQHSQTDASCWPQGCSSQREMTVLYLFILFIIHMVSTLINCSNFFVGFTIRYIHLPYVWR